MKGFADFLITSVTDVENEISLQENTQLNESQQFLQFDDELYQKELKIMTNVIITYLNKLSDYIQAITSNNYIGE